MYTSEVSRINPAHTDLCCDLIVNMATYLSTNPMPWGGQSLKAAELLRYVGALLTIMAACLSNCFCCASNKYAFEDFAIRQVALLLKKTADEAKYFGRSLVSSLSLQHSWAFT